MKLYYAPTSPFARKVRVAAHELGLADAVEAVMVDPWTDPDLRALNPLAKVPTLIRPDGQVLFESALICEYLDGLASGGLFPEPGEQRWAALLRQAVADGVAAAAGRLFADEQRPPGERSEAVMQRQAAAIQAGLDALSRDAGILAAGPFDIGAVATACALGYLDFRWPDRDWRAQRPALAAWFDRARTRPSMAATGHRLP